MSVGSLKQVELTKSVDNLNDVPYLNFGQEIQSKKNLIRYYRIIVQLCEDIGNIVKGTHMPLPRASEINILLDDPDIDFFGPRYLTVPGTATRVNRFTGELEQLRLVVANMFVSLIKRIRAELSIEGRNFKIQASRLGIGAEGEIVLDPQQPETFIESCGDALGVKSRLKMSKINDADVHTFDIDLPYLVKPGREPSL